MNAQPSILFERPQPKLFGQRSLAVSFRESFGDEFCAAQSCANKRGVKGLVCKVRSSCGWKMGQGVASAEDRTELTDSTKGDV